MVKLNRHSIVSGIITEKSSSELAGEHAQFELMGTLLHGGVSIAVSDQVIRVKRVTLVKDQGPMSKSMDIWTFLKTTAEDFEHMLELVRDFAAKIGIALDFRFAYTYIPSPDGRALN